VRTLPLATLLAPVTDGRAVARAAERLDDAGELAESVAEDVAAAVHLDDSTAVGTIGSVADRILSLADDHDVDVIAVGTHDRSWLSRLVRPSVSAAVEDRSCRPVLVVRDQRPID
jgi:nucleotide-binding universal stress UspA family protein